MRNATTEYSALLANVQANLAKLSESAGDHFGTDPDDITWAHVGDLRRINDAILSAMDVAGLEP